MTANLREWRHLDHPRRCGENRKIRINRLLNKGSPPQVRGKHSVKIKNEFSNAITPAGAGKTPETVMKWWLEKDHPRRCGENIFRPILSSEVSGSPPQVRGKQSVYHSIYH